MRYPVATHQRANQIALGCKWPSQCELEDGKGEDDERLDQVAATSLSRCKRIGSHQTNLLRQVAHNGEQTSNKKPDADVVDVGVEITPAVASPP